MVSVVAELIQLEAGPVERRDCLGAKEALAALRHVGLLGALAVVDLDLPGVVDLVIDDRRGRHVALGGDAKRLVSRLQVIHDPSEVGLDRCLRRLLKGAGVR